MLATTLRMVLLGVALMLASPATASAIHQTVESAAAIALFGEIDDGMATRIVDQMRLANSLPTTAPICLYINSPGGDLEAGGMIVDAMLSSRRPVYTVNVGMASSMASAILTYGTRRFMSPHAQMMFHNASTQLEGDITHLSSRLALLTRLVDIYTARVADLTGLPVEIIRAREDEQWWLTANDALAAHLIDGTSTPACRGPKAKAKE